MDIYGSQSDFINHINFTHDFNPGNGPEVSNVDSGNGFGAAVFWTALIPDEDVTVHPGAGTAEMHVHNLPELDYYSPGGTGDMASLGPTWQTGYFDATLSLDVIWSGPVTRRVQVRDAANGFAGVFNENQATVTWSGSSASGFSFVSNPGSFSTSVPEVPGVNGVTVPLNFFAQVGQERNGVFFPAGNPTKGAIASSSEQQILITQPSQPAGMSASITQGGLVPTHDSITSSRTIYAEQTDDQFEYLIGSPQGANTTDNSTQTNSTALSRKEGRGWRAAVDEFFTAAAKMPDFAPPVGLAPTVSPGR